MIDAINVVDIVYQRYWDNKIRVCRALSKKIGNLVTKPKEKRKGLVGRYRLTDTTINRL